MCNYKATIFWLPISSTRHPSDISTQIVSVFRWAWPCCNATLVLTSTLYFVKEHNGTRRRRFSPNVSVDNCTGSSYWSLYGAAKYHEYEPHPATRWIICEAGEGGSYFVDKLAPSDSSCVMTQCPISTRGYLPARVFKRDSNREQ